MTKPVLLATLLLPALLTAEDRWYKGNTHTHSLWSDGNDFPDMISAWYKDQGYNFLGMSDHNTLNAGEKWVAETIIEHKKITLGPKVLDKYRAYYGDEWVVTRKKKKDTAASKDTAANTGANEIEVRLKTLEEYRVKLEEPGKFLLIQAEEISASFEKSLIHINAVNLTEVIKPKKDIETLRETMRQNLQLIAEQAVKTGRPIIAHLNHPNFRWAMTADDLAHVIEDRFFEVYNGHPGTYYDGDTTRADSSCERIWDIANTIRIAELKAAPLYGVGTDDSHNYHGGATTPGRGWVMVRAGKLDANALIEAMQRGDFYASTGVTLEDVNFDKTTRKLSLKIKGQPGAKYRTEFRGTLKNYDRAVTEVASPEKDPQPKRLQHSADIGKVLATSEGLEASYTLTGDELYVRAIVISDLPMVNPPHPDHVKKAWTQPVGW
jgi:propanediol dehydratase small subunit